MGVGGEGMGVGVDGDDDGFGWGRGFEGGEFLCSKDVYTSGFMSTFFAALCAILVRFLVFFNFLFSISQINDKFKS